MNLFLKILFDERGATLAITRKTSNTLITASGFNTNYDEIEAVVNAIATGNIADGAVTVAKLGSDIARSGYGLSQHTDKTLQVDPSDTNPCLEITDGGLRVKVDGTTVTRGASGLVASGITDHGALIGLGDDDHSIYLNTARHDVIARHPISVGGTGQITAGAAFAALVAGKLYDSGWVAITPDGSTTLTHNLGTTKVLFSLYLSTASNGSTGFAVGPQLTRANTDGVNINLLSTTQIRVATRFGYAYYDTNVNHTNSSGTFYIRVIMLALE